MSEELVKSEDVKVEEKVAITQEVKPEVKPEDVKKKTPVAPAQPKKKEIDENYQYKPSDGEKLIIDKPSEPLKKQNFFMKESAKDIKSITKSNKELYESYVKDLVNFSLSVNNEVLYDSTLDRTKEFPIKFENDFFILYGRKYSYNGLKIQKINKR
jgi:hypothetical protein